MIISYKKGIRGDTMQLQVPNLVANNEFAKLSAIDLLLLSQELDSIFLEYRDSLNLERKVRFGFGDKINARCTLFSYAKPVGLSFLGTIHDLDQNRSLMASRAFYKKIYDIKKNAINLRSLDFLKAIDRKSVV